MPLKVFPPSSPATIPEQDELSSENAAMQREQTKVSALMWLILTSQSKRSFDHISIFYDTLFCFFFSPNCSIFNVLNLRSERKIEKIWLRHNSWIDTPASSCLALDNTHIQTHLRRTQPSPHTFFHTCTPTPFHSTQHATWVTSLVEGSALL